MQVWSNTSIGPYWSLAQDIATEHDAEVYTDFERLDPGPVVYVCPPTELRETDLLSLQQRLIEHGPKDGAFGVITGMTPETARSLYAPDPSERNDHAMILRTTDKDVFSYDEETTVLTREDATVPEIRSLKDADSMSIMINGRSIHSFLTDGYICGYPSSYDVSEFDGPQPYCVTDGERDCPFSGDLLPADELDVSHLFLNSCTSMIPGNGLTDNALPVHVGMGLLSNATSLIGGYRPFDGREDEVAFHYDLLRAGYDASERCYLLNKASHVTNLKSYPYVVFGTPQRRIAEPTEQQFEVTFDTTDEGTPRLTFEDIDTHVIDVVFDAPEEVLAESEVYLRNETDEHADAPLYYLLFEEDGRLRLLVYSWGRIQAEELRFSVRTEPYGGQRLSMLRASVDNAEKIDDLGFLDSKARGQIKNVRNHLSGLPSVLDEQRYDANAYRSASDRLEQAMSGIESVRDRLLSLLDRRGPGFLSGEYVDRTVSTDTAVHSESCHSCGRPVFTKEFHDARSKGGRVRGMCPQCANIFDIPLAGRDAYPQIDGDFVFGDQRPESIQFELSFTNPTDESMSVAYHPWLHADDDELRGSERFTPRTAHFELGPGQTKTAEFEMDITGIPNEDYPVYGYVVGNLDLYLGVRTLFLNRK